MTQPADTFDSYDVIGMREDLSDAIYMITPTETPAMSMIFGRGTAKNTYHEWQTDSLAAVDAANAVIEGDDATTDAIAPTTRIGNRTQISDKVSRIAGTLEATDRAGRDREMAREMMKRSKELKRDMETILCSNQASVAGNSSTARKLGGLRAWIETNTDIAGDGANNGFSAGVVGAATDGTARAFTETMLRNVSQQCWISGGNPTTLMVGAFNTRVVSSFTNHATRTIDAEDRKLIGSVKVYETDFHSLRVVSNRFSRSRDAHLLDGEYWSVDYLRAPFSIDLARTGDSERKQIVVEYTLSALNEASSGGVYDLTTS